MKKLPGVLMFLLLVLVIINILVLYEMTRLENRVAALEKSASASTK